MSDSVFTLQQISLGSGSLAIAASLATPASIAAAAHWGHALDGRRWPPGWRIMRTTDDSWGEAMDSDLRRQAVNAITYLVTVAVNGAAVALPLNGLTTAEISDRFPVLVTPANYVFSIWSVIYLLLAAFIVWQALPRNRTDPVLRSIGYLPALAGVLNALWVVLWHYEVFELTVPVMLGLLLTLIAVHVRAGPARRGSGAQRWLVGLPFSVYLGWITVATIANISQMLYRAGYRGEPLNEELWAVIILAVGVVIAAVMLMREADWAFALVIIWAYVGIAARQEAMVPVAAALVGAIVVGALIAYVLLRSRQAEDREGRASPGS